MDGMKRIKQIIESFLNIGRDPSKEIQAAWHEVVSTSTAKPEAVGLIDRLVGGVLQQAMEMQRKGATESEAKP